MERTEFDAGEGQLIVVYASPDDGTEINPALMFREIAKDAADLATERDLRLISMTSMPICHGGVFMGFEGAGFETKAAVAVAYARR